MSLRRAATSAEDRDQRRRRLCGGALLDARPEVRRVRVLMSYAYSRSIPADRQSAGDRGSRFTESDKPNRWDVSLTHDTSHHASTASGRARHARARDVRSARASSTSPHRLPTTIVATPLPMRFVTAIASPMNRWIPRISATPATGMSAGRRQRRRQHDERGAGDAGRAFRRDQEQRQQHRAAATAPSGVLVACAMNTRRNRQIDGRPIQIERIAGRNHDAHDRAAERPGPRASP